MFREKLKQRSHGRFAPVILILILIFVSTALSACVFKPASGAKAGHKADTGIPEKLKKEILADTMKNIKGIEKVTDDGQALSQYLAGTALEDMIEEIAQDKAKGKVKTRRYAKIKLNVTHYAKGVAGVAYEFDDNSYYVARGDVGKSNFAIPDRRHLSLAVAKRYGRWKIIRILQAAAKPAGTK